MLNSTSEFWLGDHALLMVEGRHEIRWRHSEAADTAIEEAQAVSSMEDTCHIGKIKQTG